jgi:U6 snRNA-associated Sm-like protein LSm1
MASITGEIAVSATEEEIVPNAVELSEAETLVKTVQEEYLPGAASLLEQLDHRILIVLRDGRHLIGKLRSFDQFMNLILEDTCERVLLTGKYCDFPLGLYIVRGDNIVLLGEIDETKEHTSMEKIDQEQYVAAMSEESNEAENLKTVWDFDGF